MLSESDKEELLTEVIEALWRMAESTVAVRRSMSAENRIQMRKAMAELSRVVSKAETAGIPLEELKNTTDEEFVRPLLDQLQT
jgi:hypothetical protein